MATKKTDPQDFEQFVKDARLVLEQDTKDARMLRLFVRAAAMEIRAKGREAGR